VRNEAVKVLKAGGVIGLPTDTLYGIAAMPDNEAAVRRLYELKGRPDDKPIALLVASSAQAMDLVEVSEQARQLGSEHWPGPLTLVLRIAADLAPWVGDRRRTVGVRVPDHKLALDVLQRSGPLAVTSANLAGEPPALDDKSARDIFGESVDLYLPGTSPGGVGSTVVDMTGPEPVVLRLGPIRI